MLPDIEAGQARKMLTLSMPETESSDTTDASLNVSPHVNFLDKTDIIKEEVLKKHA